VSDVIIFEVEDSLGVFDNGGSVGSDEEFDRLRHTIVTQESSRLTPDEFALSSSRGDAEET